MASGTLSINYKQCNRIKKLITIAQLQTLIPINPCAKFDWRFENLTLKGQCHFEVKAIFQYVLIKCLKKQHNVLNTVDETIANLQANHMQNLEYLKPNRDYQQALWCANV
jgi:hypothetical protein